MLVLPAAHGFGYSIARARFMMEAKPAPRHHVAGEDRQEREYGKTGPGYRDADGVGTSRLRRVQLIRRAARGRFGAGILE